MKRKEIPFCMPFIDDKEMRAVAAVLRGKWLTSGPEVKKFEDAARNYLGVKTAVAVASGTAALEISLAALEIGADHDVITTPYTFASTVTSIIRRGAHPVLVDVQKRTFNIDPQLITHKIASAYRAEKDGWRSLKTGRLLKAILPVHFAGQPADLTEINRLARSHRLAVIEDAAHALGAQHRGVKIGKSSNLVCFSFYSNKNLTCGEGGMIVSDRIDLAAKLRLLILHGMSRDNLARYRQGMPFYDILLNGYKANLSDIHAALGRVQMGKLELINSRRQKIAAWYDEALQEIPEIEIPFVEQHNLCSRHLYPILLSSAWQKKRDEVLRRLIAKRIFPSMHFIPIHHHSFFRGYYGQTPTLPVAEDLATREISLPIYPDLKKEDVVYIAATLKTVIRSISAKTGR